MPRSTRSARGDGLTELAPVLQRVPDVAALLRSGEDERCCKRRKASVGPSATAPFSTASPLNWGVIQSPASVATKQGSRNKVHCHRNPGAALTDWLNPQLGKVEQVGAVVVCDTTPKTMIGKLSRTDPVAEVLG